MEKKILFAYEQENTIFFGRVSVYVNMDVKVEDSLGREISFFRNH